MDYLRPPQPVLAHSTSRASVWLIGVYLLSIIYATLFPLVGWREPDGSPLNFLLVLFPRYWSSFDLATNVLAYLPLGGLLAHQFNSRISPERSIRRASALCFALSLSLEITQNYVPTRVPAWSDIVCNTLGGFAGAVVATHFFEPYIIKLKLLFYYHPRLKGWFRPQPYPALILLLLWIVIQVLPQPYLFLVGELPDNDLRHWLVQQGWFNPFEISPHHLIAIESLVVATTLWLFTVLVMEVLTAEAPRLAIGLVVLFFTLAIKSLAGDQLRNAAPFYWLTVGAQSGLLLGGIAATVTSSLKRETRKTTAYFCVGFLLVVALVLPLADFQQIQRLPRIEGAWRNAFGALRHLNFLWPWMLLLFLLSHRFQPTIRPQRRSLYN
jgi:VanZ family protein